MHHWASALMIVIPLIPTVHREVSLVKNREVHLLYSFAELASHHTDFSQSSKDDLAKLTTLIQLWSVMDIPTDSTHPMNIYHSSIHDYIYDPSNCGLPQVCNITSPHSLLAHLSLHLMTEITESTALLDALSELEKQISHQSHCQFSFVCYGFEEIMLQIYNIGWGPWMGVLTTNGQTGCRLREDETGCRPLPTTYLISLLNHITYANNLHLMRHLGGLREQQ
ncbi:uncharacterized protein BJ212DRAFT_1296383 [Suillus subaureus]|uniref:Uncharacterized protein n=1 Tax=Suillus subaureus TaxID=48587 RepID=A0A9P7EJP9_9AGAM|nr:uncharacterized protein BJ212DRAFT_1296383 [Suillus subaureus]KAG1823853.1 hypothetical protein BJ212DRAFT_1296383 [Suillus subaureus]